MLSKTFAYLASGGAYVPLDPHYPEERIAYMLKDARIAVLLTQQRLSHSAKETIYLDGDWPDIAQTSVGPENDYFGLRCSL